MTNSKRIAAGNLGTGRRDRIWCLKLWLAVVMLVLSVEARAQFEYTIQDGSVTVTTYTGTEREAVIPEEIEGLPVAGIDADWYQSFNAPARLGIPRSVVSIGKWVLEDLGLQFLDVDPLNATYASVDGILFNKARTELMVYPAARIGSSYQIPEGVTTIGESAFNENALIEVFIPSTVTKIATNAIAYSTNLTAIKVDSLNATYTSLDGVLFDKDVKELIRYPTGKVEERFLIPESVRVIRDFACAYANLRKVRIPDGVTRIGEFAFGVSKLTEITLPASLTSLEAKVLYVCESLTNVILPSNLMSIGVSSFEFCWGLKDIKIPESVTDVGEGAFSFCEGLTTFHIPKGLSRIDPSAFDYASGLASITVDDQNPAFASLDGVWFNKGLTKLLKHPQTINRSTYEIPASVTNIGNKAFYECTNLTRVAIPDSVQSIDYGAFFLCANLTEATIPEGVTRIEQFSFAGTGLKHLTIPNSVTYIGEGAFTGCKETNLTIGASVRTIGLSAFYACTNLLNVSVPNATESIGDGAFSGCDQLRFVSLGSGLTNVGWDIFHSCGKLESIRVDALNPAFSSVDGVLFDKHQTLLVRYPQNRPGFEYDVPESVSSIGNSAFYYCYNLTNITLPNSLRTIGGWAFELCFGLTAIAIPEGVSTIGPGAFTFCTSLRSITIPRMVTSIEDRTFDRCYSLERVWIPRGIVRIGESAFEGCSNLQNATIPASVTIVGATAFSGCVRLGSVYFMGKPPRTSSSAFAGSWWTTLYYLPGNAGWGDKLAGRPSVLWNPQIALEDADFGMRSNRVGFTIRGTSGLVVVVEKSTNLGNPLWAPVGTNTLSNGSSHFIDVQRSEESSCFYRLSSP